MSLIETNRIEFKRELSDDLDLEKEVVAFLNYREGGIIYVGIDKYGNPIGVDDLDGDMLKIKDRVRKNIMEKLHARSMVDIIIHVIRIL